MRKPSFVRLRLFALVVAWNMVAAGWGSVAGGAGWAQAPGAAARTTAKTRAATRNRVFIFISIR